MIESNEDLFSMIQNPMHRICITTNGSFKRNGDAVMGKGCAFQASKMFPNLAARYGEMLRNEGLINTCIGLVNPLNRERMIKLYMLPVKRQWWEHANARMVMDAIAYLNVKASGWPEITYHAPRIGCGAGQLNWEDDIRPLMMGLPDNVWVHNK